MDAGVLTHRSGGFFSLIGLHWISPDGAATTQPFLDQRAIGTLGFLLRVHQGRRQLLVQAKLEPGNVGLVQLAPTCQATDSNARRLHGGEFPPFIHDFPANGARIVYDVAHSEAGTRFFRKCNRNVLVLAQGGESIPATHRWLDVERVLELVARSHLVNTDARSVLVCAPWQQLVNREPFSRHRHGFGIELMMSAQSASRHLPIDRVRALIRHARTAVAEPDRVALDDLPRWQCCDEGLVPVRGETLRIRQIRVTVKGREVPVWDQPILDSGAEGQVDLVCGRLGGVLHFLFRAKAEAGLRHTIELTPTVVVAPGERPGARRPGPPQGHVVAECRQSEEGGRFYRDVNRYRVIDIGQATDAGRMAYWLTLGDVRQLLNEPGWLTNEARSALSLLLPWM